MQLTENFKLSEFAVSKQFPELAKEIEFSQEDVTKLFYFCFIIFQPIRYFIGKKIYILSGKRTLILNQKVDGAKNSDHLFKGFSCAVDFYTKDLQNLFSIYRIAIWDFSSAIGEIILYFTDDWEPRFIHLSLPTQKHQKEFLYNYEAKFFQIRTLPDKIYDKIFREAK